MKKLLIVICVLTIGVTVIAFAASTSAGKFTITDEFVKYIESATNPYDFGVRKDGKFYPYSTHYGRRIGYRQPVLNKKFYTQGWSKQDAEKQLRLDLDKTLQQLRTFMSEKYSNNPFDGLKKESQEILLDFAYSEGIENIKPEFFTTVINQDWDKLINTCMYVRIPDGWPDDIKNRAFANRWIYSTKPLIKLPDTK